MVGCDHGILQATRLPLQSVSDRLENERSSARARYFEGRAPGSLSQADRAVQNRQGRAAPGPGRLAAFSERPDPLDGCPFELDC